VLPSQLAELFPTPIRGIGVTLSFAAAVTIFGGFTPFVATRLIAVTGNSLSPSFYIMFTAALSIIALAFVRRRRYPRQYPGPPSPQVTAGQEMAADESPRRGLDCASGRHHSASLTMAGILPAGRGISV
jgi:hypothetical protein